MADLDSRTFRDFETVAGVYGLRVIRMTMIRDPVTRIDRSSGLVVIDMFVEWKPNVFETMMVFEKALRRVTGQDVRLGYYDHKLGYAHVPVGQALIQIDLLDLTRLPSLD